MPPQRRPPQRRHDGRARTRISRASRIRASIRSPLSSKAVRTGTIISASRSKRSRAKCCPNLTRARKRGSSATCAFHRAGDGAESENSAAGRRQDPELRRARPSGGGDGATHARAGGGASAHDGRGANPPRKPIESPRGGLGYVSLLSFQYLPHKLASVYRARGPDWTYQLAGSLLRPQDKCLPPIGMIDVIEPQFGQAAQQLILPHRPIRADGIFGNDRWELIWAHDGKCSACQSASRFGLILPSMTLEEPSIAPGSSE
jgi:hypothetical protein